MRCLWWLNERDAVKHVAGRRAHLLRLLMTLRVMLTRWCGVELLHGHEEMKDACVLHDKILAKEVMPLQLSIYTSA